MIEAGSWRSRSTAALMVIATLTYVVVALILRAGHPAMLSVPALSSIVLVASGVLIWARTGRLTPSSHRVIAIVFALLTVVAVIAVGTPTSDRDGLFVLAAAVTAVEAWLYSVHGSAAVSAAAYAITAATMVTAAIGFAGSTPHLFVYAVVVAAVVEIVALAASRIVLRHGTGTQARATT